MKKIIILLMVLLTSNVYAQTKVVVIPMFDETGAAKWLGEWESGKAYESGDTVEFDGSSYIALTAHTSSVSNIPPDASTWDLVAAAGDDGLDGDDGDDGLDGDDGDDGLDGDDGDDGLDGDDGVDGAPGVTGSPGAAATVNVGSTTTGAEGTNATVTNSGTASAAVFDFTIPRGDTGATGTVAPKPIVKDADGNVIGILLDLDLNALYVTILSDEGYLVQLNDTGQIHDTNHTLFWTGSNCDGEAYAHPIPPRIFKEVLFLSRVGASSLKIFYVPADASPVSDEIALSKWRTTTCETLPGPIAMSTVYRTYVNDPAVTGFTLINSDDSYSTPLEFAVE